MSLVYLKNKKNGVTYVYESESYWDKEKQQPRCRRKCIGKLDPITGEIVPSKRLAATDTDLHAKTVIETSGSHEEIMIEPAAELNAKRLYHGATFLFDSLGEKLGITADLKACFPNQYKQILSIAYYLILEDNNPLIRFPKWSAIHKHPFGENIPSQRSSDLFSSITEGARQRFFGLQGIRRSEKEYWAYDTTTISSYSEGLKQVKYGINKENDPLAQINLAMLFGEQSSLPFYYRKLPGNITDVKTVKNLLADMNSFMPSKIKMVMDRGFYSEDNINNMYQNHIKFLIGVKLSLKYVQKELANARPLIYTWQNYSISHDLYAYSTPITWQYKQERPYKGDTLTKEKRAYLHFYFSKNKEAVDANKFNRQLAKLKCELETDQRNPAHENKYKKFFEVKSTPKRGITILPKQEAIDDAMKNFGYFALLSNEIKDPIAALDIYRNKDLVEKAFGNLKERLNFRRMEVSSELSLDGKIFVEFIALIYLSYIKKKMQEKDLFKNYTLQGLLDELDVIECYQQPGRSLRWGEFTKKQENLFYAMDVTPPT